jgi:1,4-alpha-glucan branching enzyme
MDQTDDNQGTEKFGFNVDKENNITYREWAPNATQAFLIGDFSISLSLSQISFCSSHTDTW